MKLKGWCEGEAIRNLPNPPFVSSNDRFSIHSPSAAHAIDWPNPRQSDAVLRAVSHQNIVGNDYLWPSTFVYSPAENDEKMKKTNYFEIISGGHECVAYIE